MSGRHEDLDGNHIADRTDRETVEAGEFVFGVVELCDERARDADGALLEGFPDEVVVHVDTTALDAKLAHARERLDDVANREVDPPCT